MQAFGCVASNVYLVSLLNEEQSIGFSPMYISLHRFLETGALGDLRVKISVEQVCALLGTPDDMGGTSRKYPSPTIYVYGSVELFFAQKAPVFCQAIYWYAHRGEFRLTSGCVVEDWGLTPGMRRAEVEAYLRQAGLEFSSPTKHSTVVAETLVLPSGITITLDDDAILYSISAWAP